MSDSNNTTTPTTTTTNITGNTTSSTAEGISSAAATTSTSGTTDSTKQAEPVDNTPNLYSCLVYCEQGAPMIEKEHHLKRMKILRKELTFLKDTEWMYDHLD